MCGGSPDRRASVVKMWLVSPLAVCGWVRVAFRQGVRRDVGTPWSPGVVLRFAGGGVAKITAAAWLVRPFAGSAARPGGGGPGGEPAHVAVGVRGCPELGDLLVLGGELADGAVVLGEPFLQMADLLFEPVDLGIAGVGDLSGLAEGLEPLLEFFA